ncbi:hypothetical protein EDD15DRAFT_2195446 [Pisolithus albus]|nr:hypothetical protein EDD15DRAFT_2195446 [Pisolithus albus]
MSHPTTRAKNAHQHPGHIILEGKQKRRTSEQKQADDAVAERACEEQEAAQKRGIQRLANIIDDTIQEEENRLTNPPKPRPRLCLIIKDPSHESADTTESVMGDSDRLASDVTGMDPADKRPSGEVLADSQGSGELLVYGLEESEVGLEESLTEVVQKQKRTQKTSSRDAVLAARGEPGGGGGADRIMDWHSMDVQKRKPTSACLDTDKQKFSGIGDVADWADKLASSKPLHTLLSQHSAASSRHARSISSTGTSSQIKLRTTPASTHSSTRPSTPAFSNPPTSETCNDDSPYLQGNDNSECQAMSNPSLKSVHHRTDTMAITDIVSSSELDESEPSPPSPSQYTHPRKGRVSSGSGKVVNVQDDYVEPSTEEMDDDVLLVETKRGIKRAPRSQGETSSTTAPPSKRVKMPRVSAGQGSQCSGSGANKKYINSDLPAGATNDNAWRWLFISTLAHFAASYDNPWTIPDDKFKNMLQEIWDTVYWEKVVYTVVTRGPVYSLAKQGLNNWWAGFAAAAVAVITTFFTHDADFDDLTTQNRGTDNKTWTGLWRAPFILQTFAHHFNFIQGHTDVPMLSEDFSEPCTALALASAAVCRTLSLIAEGHMSFKITQPSDVWTAVIPKGGQFEFGEAVWGAVTRRYLEPIKRLSHEQLLIVDDTQKFVKKATFTVANTLDSGGEDEFDDLFTFR